jgi:hypothetical protein
MFKPEKKFWMHSASRTSPAGNGILVFSGFQQKSVLYIQQILDWYFWGKGQSPHAHICTGRAWVNFSKAKKKPATFCTVLSVVQWLGICIVENIFNPVDHQILAMYRTQHPACKVYLFQPSIMDATITTTTVTLRRHLDLQLYVS